MRSGSQTQSPAGRSTVVFGPTVSFSHVSRGSCDFLTLPGSHWRCFEGNWKFDACAWFYTACLVHVYRCSGGTYRVCFVRSMRSVFLVLSSAVVDLGLALQLSRLTTVYAIARCIHRFSSDHRVEQRRTRSVHEWVSARVCRVGCLCQPRSWPFYVGLCPCVAFDIEGFLKGRSLVAPSSRNNLLMALL